MLDTVGQPVILNRLRSDERKFKLTFVVFGVFIIIFILNLLWVNTIVLQSRYSGASTVAITIPTPSVTPIPTVIITPTPSSTTAPATVVTTTAAKDYFIPFGAGAGQSDDWKI